MGCSGTCGITDVQLTYLQQLHSGIVSRRTKIFEECFQLLCELLRWRIKTVLESPRFLQGAPDKVALEQRHSTVIGNIQTKGKKVVYVMLCVKCLKQFTHHVDDLPEGHAEFNGDAFRVVGHWSHPGVVASHQVFVQSFRVRPLERN